MLFLVGSCGFLFCLQIANGVEIPRGFYVYPSTGTFTTTFAKRSVLTGAPVLLAGVSTNETERTPEIVALARALQNDPKQIFEYVRNNIDYVPLWGSRNGATATLLAKRGNDLDQCSLLIALLRAANPATDARYVQGDDVLYPSSFMANLLNVSSSQIVPFLTSCRVQSYTVGPYTVGISYHFWVQVTVDGATRVLDPAFKEYEYFPKMDGLNAMGYDRTQFLARAMSGATISNYFARSVNETNIRSDLVSYSTNLISYIRHNHANDSFVDVIGGRRIIPEHFDSLPTELPYCFSVSSQSSGTSLPTSYCLTLRVQHRNIDRTFKGYEIAGKRVSILYTGANNSPELRVDGSLVQTGLPTTNGQTYGMTMVLSTPTTDPVTNSYTLISGKSYVIAFDFGAASAKLIDRANAQLAKDRNSGLSETSEAVLGGTLHVMSLTWFHELALQQKAMSSLLDVPTVGQYLVGLMAQESGYYLNVNMTAFGSIHKDGDVGKWRAAQRTTALFGSALEHGMMEQLQGTNKSSSSTAKLLRLGNAASRETYLATNGNWYGAGGIRNCLTNYQAQELATLDAAISSGMSAVLPRDGNLAVGQWSGAGYALFASNSFAMMINGGYKGAYSGSATPIVIAVAADATTVAYSPPPAANLPTVVSDEPVDLGSGRYLFDNTDISLGTAEPWGMHFRRSYNSGLNQQDGSLRFGWTHNYDMRARMFSHGDPVFGERQAVDFASFMVSSLIAADVLEQEPNIKGWVVADLVTMWSMDQSLENAVSIQLGSKSLEYIRLPDGSYNPPPGVTTTLTKSNGLYQLAERFGTRWDFGSNNRISAWKDADGNALSFSYNSQTNLSVVSNSFGRKLTFTYSGNTQLTSVADSSGRTTSYSYAGSDLTGYTDPEGKRWGYAYDSAHRMTKLTNGLNQITASNTYDSLGMVVTQRNGSGYCWKFYVVPGFRGIEEDPKGGRTTHYFDEEGREIGVENALSNRTYAFYDGQGHITNTVDAREYPTIFQYDGNHNRTNTIDALGNRTSYEYDSLCHLIKITDPLQHTTTFGYDAEHHVTNVVDALTNSTRTTCYANGLPQTVTDPRGNVISYTYDAHGNVATIQRTDGGTEIRTNNVRGDVLSRTDANSNTTVFTYDKRRLVTSERDPLTYAVSNIYNNAGLLLRVIDRRGYTNASYGYSPTYKVLAVTNALGGVVINRYDERDYLVSVRDPLIHVTSNRYDAAGRVVEVVDPLGHGVTNRYDANGNVVSVQDALGNTISNQYDELNRLVRTIEPLGSETLYEYDAVGRVTAVVDPLGARTENTYDAVGRKIATRRPGNVVESFTYDAVGNLLAFVNGEGRSMSFSYDGMNRARFRTNALNQVESYTYDPVGNQRTRTDGKTQTVNYAYNAANRLTSIVYPSGVPVTMWYDRNGNLTNIVDATGTNRYSYDVVNRLTDYVEGTVASGLVLRVSYSYDLVGNRTNMTCWTNKLVAYSYDAANRLTNVTDWASRKTIYTYDNANRLTAIAYPNGVSAAYTPDADGRLAAYQYVKGTSFIARTITRNALGHKTLENVAAGLQPMPTLQAVETRAHDNADRLTNVISRTAPDAGSSATNLYTYDANGNLVSAPSGVQCSWDFDNRLTQYQASCIVCQYAYDGLGDRIRRVANSVTNYHVLDRAASLHNVLVEVNANATPARYYIWGANGLLAQVETNGTAYYFHSDELGSTLALTDTNGNRVAQYAYGPNGESWGYTGTVQTAYTFIGGHGVYHETADLYHMKARYYSAEYKRFLSADPIGLAGGLNLYVYGSDNPLAFLDVLGLWGEEIHFGSEAWGGTMLWAQDQRVGFSEQQARIVARADQSVDSAVWTVGSTGPMPWQDQSRHFNTTPNALSGTAQDSRMIHAEQSLSRAIELHQQAQSFAQGSFIDRHIRAPRAERNALRELGTGLHSLQDVYAHADEFVATETRMGVTYRTHLGNPEADRPGRVPGSPNLRLLNTRDATIDYLGRYTGAGTTQSGPAK